MPKRTHFPVTRSSAVLSLWAALVLTGVLSCAGEEAAQHAPSGFGSIEGRVRFLGTVPQGGVVDNAGRRRPILNVEGSENGLRYAVVRLSRIMAMNPMRAKAIRSKRFKLLIFCEVRYSIAFCFKEGGVCVWCAA